MVDSPIIKKSIKYKKRKVIEPKSFVLVEEDDAEDLLRGLTEIRFTIRSTSLKNLSDEELEGGLTNLKNCKPEVRIGYFAYLLMAEVQERLVQEIS